MYPLYTFFCGGLELPTMDLFVAFYGGNGMKLRRKKMKKHNVRPKRIVCGLELTTEQYCALAA